MEKKFELTENYVVNEFGTKLYQIKCINSFGNVKKGKLGGFIEKEENLSQGSDAWVSGNAMVYGNARVSGNAWVSGNARVYDNARVSGNAWVYGNAMVYGAARVCGNARVCGDTLVYGDTKVCK